MTTFTIIEGEKRRKRIKNNECVKELFKSYPKLLYNIIYLFENLL